MKAKVFTLSLVFIIGTQGFAQISENLRFGFTVTPQVSWLGSDDKTVKYDKPQTGLTVGTTAEWYLNENYILTSGLGLTFGRGGTIEHEIGGRLLPDAELSSPLYDTLPDNSKLKYDIQYLEIPIGFRMRSREFGRFRLTFEAPIITFGIKIKAKADIEAPGLETTTEENISSEVNLFNMSYGFGAGTEYTLTENISILLMLQYTQGFLDVTKDHGVLRNGNFEDSKGTIGHFALKTAVLF